MRSASDSGWCTLALGTSGWQPARRMGRDAVGTRHTQCSECTTAPAARGAPSTVHAHAVDNDARDGALCRALCTPSPCAWRGPRGSRVSRVSLPPRASRSGGAKECLAAVFGPQRRARCTHRPAREPGPPLPQSWRASLVLLRPRGLPVCRGGWAQRQSRARTLLSTLPRAIGPWARVSALLLCAACCCCRLAAHAYHSRARPWPYG